MGLPQFSLPAASCSAKTSVSPTSSALTKNSLVWVPSSPSETMASPTGIRALACRSNPDISIPGQLTLRTSIRSTDCTSHEPVPRPSGQVTNRWIAARELPPMSYRRLMPAYGNTSITSRKS